MADAPCAAVGPVGVSVLGAGRGSFYDGSDGPSGDESYRLTVGVAVWGWVCGEVVQHEFATNAACESRWAFCGIGYGFLSPLYYLCGFFGGRAVCAVLAHDC